MNQVEDNGKNKHEDNECDTNLSFLNISTSKTHDVLEMGKNALLSMNEGLYFNENLVNVHLNPKEVRNCGIKY